MVNREMCGVGSGWDRGGRPARGGGGGGVEEEGSEGEFVCV